MLSITKQLSLCNVDRDKIPDGQILFLSYYSILPFGTFRVFRLLPICPQALNRQQSHGAKSNFTKLEPHTGHIRQQSQSFISPITHLPTTLVCTQVLSSICNHDNPPKWPQSQYIHVVGKQSYFEGANLIEISCYSTSRAYDACPAGIIQLPQRVYQLM